MKSRHIKMLRRIKPCTDALAGVGNHALEFNDSTRHSKKLNRLSSAPASMSWAKDFRPMNAIPACS
ncbi:MAG: hypothetical protein K2Q13_00165 [Nitrosomonas sp.]|uniref:hypothetical protein n=1 Tax=Nitrosomonas sp. TaxID=42353 RepID=UPI0025EFE92B|nr:hypothetical protein [Nitrosomonas sp.]MBY0473458.1 hypothetical protein [Nitrosomonas sp.]